MPLDFAEFMQGQAQAPAVQKPSLDFSAFMQSNVSDQVEQPATQDFSKFMDSRQKLTVTGVNNTPPPRIAPPLKLIQDTELNDYLKPILDQDPALGSQKLTNFLSGIVSTIATPFYDMAQSYYSQQLINKNKTIFGGKILGGQDSSASTPSSIEPDSVMQDRAIRDNLVPVYTDANGNARTVLNDLAINNKTAAQVGGDWAQAIMMAYVPDLGADLLTAGFTNKAAGETILRLFAKGAVEGGINFGLPFGVAQALSSGTTDPKEFTKIVATNMAVAGLFSGVTSIVAPTAVKGIQLTSNIIDQVNKIQDNVYGQLLQKGYTPDQAYALTSQGGYANALPDNPNIKTPIDPDWVKSDDLTPGIVEQLKNAEAGKKIFTPAQGQGGTMEVSGQASTFPDWIPEDLRRSDIVGPVAEHLQNGTLPATSATRQTALYNYIAEMIDAEGMAKDQAREMSYNAGGQLDAGVIQSSLEEINKQISQAQADEAGGQATKGPTNDQRIIPPAGGQTPPGEIPQTGAGTDGPQIKQRGFLTSIKSSPNVAEGVASDLQGNYTVQTDRGAVSKASNLIINDPQAAHNLAVGPDISKDANTTAIMLFKEANARYKASMDRGSPDMEAIHDAKTYAENAAQKLTTAAQTVQSAHLLDSGLSDPDTALFKAAQFINRETKKAVPGFDEAVTKIGQQITDLHNQVVDQIIDETPELQKPIEETPKAKTKTTEAPAAKKYSTGDPFVDELLNYKGDPEQEVAKNVSREIATPKQKEVNLIKDMVATLTKVAKEDLPAKAKAVTRDPMEFIREALNNKSEYQTVFDKAQGILLTKYANDADAMPKLKDFFQRDLSGELPIAESQITGALKNTMKEQGITLGDIVRQHYTVYNQASQGLAEDFVRQAGASPEDAQALADRVQKRFDELASTKKQQILKQMFKQINIKPPKSMIAKINEMTNLGAFDQASLRGFVADKLHLPSLSDTDAKMIVDRSSYIQDLKNKNPNALLGSPESKQIASNISSLEKAIKDMAPQDGTKKWLVHPFKMSIFSFAFDKKIGGELSMVGLEGGARGIAAGLDKVISETFNMDRDVYLGADSIMTYARGLKENAGSAADYFKTGSASGIQKQLQLRLGKDGINDFSRDIKYFNSPILSKWVNAPGRILGTTTQLFGDAAASASLYESAVLQAMNEGLTGDAYNTRVQELFKNPSDQAALDAIKFAAYMTFQDDSVLAKAFQGLKKPFLNRGGSLEVGAEVTLPVVKTPVNILQRLLTDFGPGSPFKLIADQLDPVTRGKKSFVLDIGRMSVGGALMAGGYWLASKGLATGNYPSTKAESDAWTAEGKTTNSVLLGNKWQNIGVEFAPAGDLIGLGADLFNLHKDSSGLALVEQAGSAAIQKIGDLPMLYGLSSTLQTIQNPSQYGEKFTQRLAGSLVPTVVRRIAQVVDPVKRNPGTSLQQIESEIPGLSKKVPAAVDVLGNPIQNPASLNPLQASLNKPSPLLDEAARLGVNITTPNQTIDGIKLTNAEYQTYQEKRGKVLNIMLNTLMYNPAYNALDDDNKKLAFQDVDRDVTTLVNGMAFPALMIRRYGLPANTDLTAVKDGISSLTKKYGTKFTKASTAKQAQALKALLGIAP